MTPGTAAGKKKNVTFGDHVVDNQEKRPLKSGLPDDCPGKFPSPWNKNAEGEKDGAGERTRGRNKLTEALEQARDESRQRGDQANREARSPSPAKENDCCAYWRREYEAYRTNTQREVKKLVKKYKAAKDYAQSKDDEASETRTQLYEAETKADALEEAVNILTAQIKDLEEKLRAQPQSAAETETLVPPATKAEPARERPRDLLALLERRGSNQRTVSGGTARTNENDQLQRPSEPRPTSIRRTEGTMPVPKSIEPTNATERRKEDAQSNPTTEKAATTKAVDHVSAAGRTPATVAARWAAVKEAPQRPSEPAPTSTRRGGETLTSRHRPDLGTARATTSNRPARTEKAVADKQTPTEQHQQPSTQPTKPPSSTSAPVAPHDSGDLFLPSEPAVYSPPTKPNTSLQPTVESAPPSEAGFSDNASPPPPPPAHGNGTIPARPQKTERQDSGSGGTMLKTLSANARSGNGTTGAGVGGTHVGRDGKEIDRERLEAAKARIKARGRDVS